MAPVKGRNFKASAFFACFALGVASSTATLAAIAQIYLLTVERPRFILDGFPPGIFVAVAMATAFISALPAFLAYRRNWSLLRFGLSGGLVGALGMATVAVVSLGGWNIFDGSIWRRSGDAFLFVPAFGVAGVVGGLAFGLLQRALSRTRPHTG